MENQITISGPRVVVMGFPILVIAISLSFGILITTQLWMFTTPMQAAAQLSNTGEDKLIAQIAEIRREHAEVLKDHDTIITELRDNQELIRALQNSTSLNSTAAIGVLSGNAVMSGWLLRVMKK